MARIYDNLDVRFADGLQGIITNVGVRRIDFCVGKCLFAKPLVLKIIKQLKSYEYKVFQQ